MYSGSTSVDLIKYRDDFLRSIHNVPPYCTPQDKVDAMLAAVNNVMSLAKPGSQNVWLDKGLGRSLRPAEEFVGRMSLSHGRARFVVKRQLIWLAEQVTERHNKEKAALVAWTLRQDTKK